jgi:hypothetical protein
MERANTKTEGARVRFAYTYRAKGKVLIQPESPPKLNRIRKRETLQVMLATHEPRESGLEEEADLTATSVASFSHKVLQMCSQVAQQHLTHCLKVIVYIVCILKAQKPADFATRERSTLC